MVWWQVILFPLAILYDGITRLRNHLFNISSTPSFEFEANVISVGNLAVGGTGKTPMVVWLIEHFLAQEKQVAVLSRGYKRKTRGLRIATDDESSQTLGDESFMYWRRYHEQGVLVAVAEERAWAIPWVLAEQPENDVILLDDAFQHRAVNPSLNILLTTWQRPFFNDHVLPSGRLRERRAESRRADLVIVTKSPEKTSGEKQDYQQQIAVFTQQPVLFSTVIYGEPKPFVSMEAPMPRSFVLVAGLASNEDFIEWSKQHFDIQEVLSFGDHHRYQKGDIRKLTAMLGRDVGLLTTEKDAVKLIEWSAIQDFSCWFVPISVQFLEGEEKFLQTIDGCLMDYNRDPSQHMKDG